jgi:RNA polymerase sigma-70 factor (ECF subfamily)
MDIDEARIFEEARPRLLGLAYRILGSRADAEDAVQDCFLKWGAADRTVIENPAAWLTTACTRRCLDLLRSANRARVDYVGAWLPEPVVTAGLLAEDSRVELASSLSAAFLLMLERLTPRERAAYLLHEIFDRPYAEIAATLEMAESACRKLVSRAKANLDQSRVRHVTPPETQHRLLQAFEEAVTSGTASPLAALLSSDIRLTADGGGKARAILGTLEGHHRVLAFLRHAHKWWAGYRWTPTEISGGHGVILSDGDMPVAAISFAYDDAGQVADIFIMRNPDKLARLEPIAIQ